MKAIDGTIRINNTKVISHNNHSNSNTVEYRVVGNTRISSLHINNLIATITNIKTRMMVKEKAIMQITKKDTRVIIIIITSTERVVIRVRIKIEINMIAIVNHTRIIIGITMIKGLGKI